jgi:rhodanese-related sulfurtransferase
MISTISATEAAERCRAAGTVILDVRTPAEFEEVHADVARNVPLDRLDPQTLSPELRRDGEPLFVICKSGTRGQKACEKLTAAGWLVINIEGGTTAWEAAGLPVVRGRKTMSLERQVRIAAGFLVFAGVTLGWFVHPGFFGLSAFVGAGLMFAGITDTCAMGMAIAKLPWNQRGASHCPAGQPASK